MEGLKPNPPLPHFNYTPFTARQANTKTTNTNKKKKTKIYKYKDKYKDETKPIWHSNYTVCQENAKTTNKNTKTKRYRNTDKYKDTDRYKDKKYKYKIKPYPSSILIFDNTPFTTCWT